MLQLLFLFFSFGWFSFVFNGIYDQPTIVSLSSRLEIISSCLAQWVLAPGKDVEILTATAENIFRIAMVRLTFAKLR